MGVTSSMTGTPWHKERVHRAEGDERRHRSYCVHYRKSDKHCTYRCIRCIGSAHCDYYSRKMAAAEDSVEKYVPVQTTYVSTKEEESKKQMPELNVAIQDCVMHKMFGSGVVQEIENNKIVVEFDSVGVKRFIYPDAFFSGFLIQI